MFIYSLNELGYTLCTIQNTIVKSLARKESIMLSVSPFTKSEFKIAVNSSIQSLKKSRPHETSKRKFPITSDILLNLIEQLEGEPMSESLMRTLAITTCNINFGCRCDTMSFMNLKDISFHVNDKLSSMWSFIKDKVSGLGIRRRSLTYHNNIKLDMATET
eukprot:TRINITY_DN681_c0_g2_i2.p1 TRINITY_DN681_c0_g2~~TRINITY_DN681_c0_g2_i2.p1  ORF type:complete len:161 (-),score=19.77 TRINITY_DN681_c0_g2_i2:707-1189(-)